MAKQPKNKSCTNCKFCIEEHNGGVNVCKRFPPLRHKDATRYADFPTIKLADWCGEWQPSSKTK